jgi:hypothetical protein
MNGPAINKFCVNPVTNTFIIYYNDGTWQDTGIQASCSIQNNAPCFSAGQICTPKSCKSFINTIQYTENNEMIIGYSDGNICSLGTICKCTNVLFGNSEYPGCECPNTRCGDVYINMENGNVFKFFGRTWDKIGNIGGPTGPTGPMGPTGNGIESATIVDDSLIVTFTNGQVENAGNIIGPTGPTGTNQYTGTGFFGTSYFSNAIDINEAIDLFRQPYIFYPTCFGTGIGRDINSTPEQDAIVLGNHNDATGPNNENYTIAIGYQSGQINQGENAIAIGKNSGYYNQYTNSIAIGKESGYNYQNTGSIAIGYQAGYTGLGQYSIAIGYGAGMTGQAANSIVISAGGPTVINNTTANSTVIYPIRNVNGTSSTRLFWDPSTYEVTYGSDASSIRYKENVIDLPQRYIDNVHKLRPVEFTFKSTPNKKQIGMIAEQVDEFIPEIVIRNAIDENVIEGIDYKNLIAPLVQIVKEYKDKIKYLENLLDSTIESYETRLSRLEQL